MNDAPYTASRISRRATSAEMEERALFLISYARQHGPVNVRGLYYQAEVHHLPGILKDERSYEKIQRQVLNLRRAGRLEYEHIADATRWMRKPPSHDSIEDALQETARLYRRNLWLSSAAYLEIWLEKDALAGVIYPVTSLYDVPLMVTRGFSSETFAFEAVEARGDDRRPYVICYLGDHDRSGYDAAVSLREKLLRFAEPRGIPIDFGMIAVTRDQIRELNLPTRPHKRTTAADRNWPLDYAVELDAIPPHTLRQIVEDAINEHLPQDQLRVLKAAEESEREILLAFASARGAGDPMTSQPSETVLSSPHASDAYSRLVAAWNRATPEERLRLWLKIDERPRAPLLRDEDQEENG